MLRRGVDGRDVEGSEDDDAQPEQEDVGIVPLLDCEVIISAGQQVHAGLEVCRLMRKEFHNGLVASDLAHVVNHFELEAHPLWDFIFLVFEVFCVNVDIFLKELHNGGDTFIKERIKQGRHF